jgi:hypothetical protein
MSQHSGVAPVRECLKRTMSVRVADKVMDSQCQSIARGCAPAHDLLRVMTVAVDTHAKIG